MTDDDITLEDIDNVGPSVAEDLEDAGFDSVSAVANADEDALDEVSTFVENRSSEIIASATDLTSDTDSDAESESIDEAELVEELKGGDTQIEETATSSDDDGPETFDVELEITEEIYPHIIGAVIEEQTRGLQRNNHDDVEVLDAILDDLTEAYVDQDGDVRVVEISSLEMDDLNLLRQAVSSQMADYRSRAGISRLWGKIQDVVDEIDEYRDVNHGA